LLSQKHPLQNTELNSIQPDKIVITQSTVTNFG
jgi:hypothetical protein